MSDHWRAEFEVTRGADGAVYVRPVTVNGKAAVWARKHLGRARGLDHVRGKGWRLPDWRTFQAVWLEFEREMARTGGRPGHPHWTHKYAVADSEIAFHARVAARWLHGGCAGTPRAAAELVVRWHGYSPRAGEVDWSDDADSERPGVPLVRPLAAEFEAFLRPPGRGVRPLAGMPVRAATHHEAVAKVLAALRARLSGDDDTPRCVYVRWLPRERENSTI